MSNRRYIGEESGRAEKSASPIGSLIDAAAAKSGRHIIADVPLSRARAWFAAQAAPIRTRAAATSFFQPTILVDRPGFNAASKEETFGPSARCQVRF